MLIKINKQKFYLGIIISLIFFFSIQKIFYTSSIFLEKIISYIAYPIVKTQGKISNLIESYKKQNESIDKLKIQLEQAQSERENLIFENVLLKSSLGYLEQISELIEFRKKINIDSSLITCQIIHKQISEQGHYSFIDKGSNNGVEKDMVAIYKNCLLGKVIEVYPKYSKIIYITDKSCKIASYCFKSGAIGIYEGSNELEVSELNYVNHLNNLLINDLVISSGEGLIFPQGFAIGKISNFQKNQIHYKIDIKPIIDVSKIKHCQLIKKN